MVSSEVLATKDVRLYSFCSQLPRCRIKLLLPSSKGCSERFVDIYQEFIATQFQGTLILRLSVFCE